MTPPGHEADPGRLSRLDLAPISGTLGTEVASFDLSAPLDPADIEALRQTLAAYGVLVFRDQDLSPAQMTAFARRLGPLFVHPHIAGLERCPQVLLIQKEPHETTAFGGVCWHSDVTYLNPPAMASLLYALEVPRRGGDTLFANQYLAYEGLSPGLRDQLDRLSAVHSYDGPGRPAVETVEHPVVRRHPVSGRKALYVNAMFTSRFSGMTEAESRPLLTYLYAQATRDEITCRVRWQPGTAALWDNRCVQHYPVNDYQGERRTMHRVTVMESPA